MRSSAGAAAGDRRSASPNQCAALAGASRTASSPASRRTADGAGVALARRALHVVGARGRRGPARRERRRRCARGRPGASRPRWRRRPRGERADAGSGSGAARRSCGGDRASAARRSPPSPPPRASRPRPRPARARTGRPPPPLLPARDVRDRDSSASSSASAAATIGGTPIAASERLVVRRRAAGRAVGRPRELLEVEGIAAALHVEGVRVGAATASPRSSRASSALSARSSIRVSRSARHARSSAVDRRSGTWRGRMASARSTGAAGGRRRSAPSSSIDAGSAQCRSSSTSTSGCVDASCSSSVPHGTVAAIALVLERHLAAARERRQRREDVRELAANVVVERAEAVRPEPSHVLVERVHEDGEGQVALELGGRAREDEVSRASARAATSARRRVLPMPGSPTSSVAAERPWSTSANDAIERTELLGAPDEMVGLGGHFSSRRG